MSDLAVRPDAWASWVSGSGLNSAINCAASAVLWKVLGTAHSATTIGQALHEHIRQRNLYGVQEAMELLPILAQRFGLDDDEASLFIARAKAFEWSPPRGAVAELPLCLFDDGRVEIVKGGKGVYDLPSDALIPSQIDLFWSEPTPLYVDGDRIVCPPDSVLWVVDFKSGKEDYVPAAERNAQALAGAILAARFTGAKSVIPGIVYLRKGQGIWDVPEHALDLAGIDRAQAILTTAVHEVRAARKLHAEGGRLTFREGMHCAFCRGRNECPAHLSTLRHYLADPIPVEPHALEVTQLQRLAEVEPLIRRFADSIRSSLLAHVQSTGEPIELSDGRVWGPYAKSVESFDVDKAIDALAVEIGSRDEAEGIAPRKLSKKKIETVIKENHARRGIRKQKSYAMKSFYGRLARADGIRRSSTVRWGVHKPPPAALPEVTELTIAALNGLPMDEDFDEDEED